MENLIKEGMNKAKIIVRQHTIVLMWVVDDDRTHSGVRAERKVAHKNALKRNFDVKKIYCPIRHNYGIRICGVLLEFCNPEEPDELHQQLKRWAKICS